MESQLSRPVSDGLLHQYIYVQFDQCVWDDATWLLYAGEHENFINLINLNKVFPGSNILNVEATNRESIRVERLSDSEVIEEIVAKLQKCMDPLT